MKSRAYVFIYPLLSILYLIFSFAYTDPNQIFSSHPLYWNFQQSMWQLGYHHRPQSTFIYVLIICLFFVGYALMLKAHQQHTITFKQILYSLLASTLILLIANPALSHDLYNYLFNAKMVWYYRANPHVQVALNFPQDDWLRFMHNTHTPAPYGYGWTALSVIPAWIAQNHLKTTLLLFKLLVGSFFYVLLFLQTRVAITLGQKKWQFGLLLFALNPLVLIETFGNGHNDVVMMALAILSLLLAVKAIKQRRPLLWPMAITIFILSVSIKFASIALLGGVGLYAFMRYGLKKPISLGTANALAIFTPLLTTRSQRFLPWYLIWPLSFMPFITEDGVKKLAVLFSFSSLIAYAPFLLAGQYSPTILFQRTLITFLLPGVLLITYLLIQRAMATIRK